MAYHCFACSEEVCLWDQYAEDVINEVESWASYEGALQDSEPFFSNSSMRKRCYRVFTVMHHGYLGKGNRLRIPECVKEGIRNSYPDLTYMGHMDA